MKKLVMMTALTLLTACEKANQREWSAEREDSAYRSAMGDYHAGRMDAAIDGFRSVLKKDPANSSDRFQLACLLQDVKHDARAAFCAFEEYLLQNPDSDKSEIAQSRLSQCEKELAKLLAAKHGLLDKDGLVKELDFVRGELKNANAKLAEARNEASVQADRITALTEERGRLMKVVKGESMVESDAAAARPSAPEIKDLLEDEDGSGVDRIRMSSDIANLKAEEVVEQSSGPSLIAPRQVDDVAKRDAARAEEEARKKAAAERLRGPAHPKTYVIQEGDTLFRIAARFYGRISAWRTIRDANKAVISTDGRVRTGDTIVLP